MKFSWSQNQPIVCSAPMHGITNSAQRQIFKKFGADLVFSEMVSSMGINYTNQKTIQKTNFKPTEKPIIIQIFGNTIEETVRAGRFAEEIGADGVDFNCGCPAKSMIASGNGGKLLLEPDKLIEVLKSVKDNINLPLSLKTRIGYDKVLPPSFYKKIARKAGIDALIIHGRTIKQMYRGQADWNQIKSIAQTVDIPVIGSGDITTPHQALNRIKNFTTSGVMIGRGALGNPWIFEQTRKLIAGQIIRPRFSINKIIKTMNLHLNLMISEFRQNRYYSDKFNHKEIEQHAVHNMRKHFGWYLKDFRDAKQWRIKLIKCNTKSKVKKIMNQIKHYYENN